HLNIHMEVLKVAQVDWKKKQKMTLFHTCSSGLHLLQPCLSDQCQKILGIEAHQKLTDDNTLAFHYNHWHEKRIYAIYNKGELSSQELIEQTRKASIASTALAREFGKTNMAHYVDSSFGAGLEVEAYMIVNKSTKELKTISWGTNTETGLSLKPEFTCYTNDVCAPRISEEDIFILIVAALNMAKHLEISPSAGKNIHVDSSFGAGLEVEAYMIVNKSTKELKTISWGTNTETGLSLKPEFTCYTNDVCAPRISEEDIFILIVAALLIHRDIC
ncbi:hypothetical protein ACJX0J_024220, partial [Zea mays]